MAELKTTAEFRAKYRSDNNPFILWGSESNTNKLTDFDFLDDIETLLVENQRLTAEVEKLKEYEWMYKDLCE